MTASFAQQVFHVPYSGHITAVDPGTVESLKAVETPAVMDAFYAQMDRLHGIDVGMAQPAVGGGILVSCKPDAVQGIYDQVFGSSGQASARVVSFPAKKEATASPRFDFSYAAMGYRSPLRAFAMASMPTNSANANVPTFSPVLNAA